MYIVKDYNINGLTCLCWFVLIIGSTIFEKNNLCSVMNNYKDPTMDHVDRVSIMAFYEKNVY